MLVVAAEQQQRPVGQSQYPENAYLRKEIHSCCEGISGAEGNSDLLARTSASYRLVSKTFWKLPFRLLLLSHEATLPF